MKVRLNEEKAIKGRLYESGDIVVVRKDYGERMIIEGVADRIIGEVDNRITVASDNRGHRWRTYTTFKDSEFKGGMTNG